jgi:type IV pilus assembly protein PilW
MDATPLYRKWEKGFTITELLISMVIGGIVLGALVDTFVTQRQTYDLQEQIAEMMQNARVGIEMISRDVHMAGYNPSGVVFNGITYNTTQLEIRADLNGNGTLDDTDETIIYSLDSPNRLLIKNANGVNQELAEHTTAFTFNYLDADGNPTTTSADIRQVQVQITTRTSKPDPDYAVNEGYRTFTLTSLITPRN